MALTVEFAGFPGSGKSTIVRRLAKKVPHALRLVVDRPDPSAPVPPGVTARQAELWRRLHPRWDDHDALRVLVARYGAQLAVPERQGVTLLEEGIVHRLWRDLFLSPELVACDWSPLLDVAIPLIVIDADDATLHQRVGAKRQPGTINAALASMSPSDPVWHEARVLYRRVLEVSADHRPVVTVDASGTLRDSIRDVRTAVDRLDARTASDIDLTARETHRP